jgi:hypothetical protein
MSKYSDVVYGGSKYGITNKLSFSAEPVNLVVVKFHETYVTWASPSGDFTRFRLVRNQDGFPETQEDGIVLFERLSEDGSSIAGTLPTSFLDGEENPTETPIVPGRNIFYSIFLYTTTDEWIVAGKATDVVPENTGATEKIVNLLPRVYTTPELSPLGVVDKASDLYNFLDGMSFTYEQMMTQLKLIRPSHNTDYANTSTIEAEMSSLGLNPEPTLSSSIQRRLIREAIPSYSSKGTLLGVENYAESLTGFIPNGTISSNLMLTPQDSTFYNSTGRWVPTNATIAATEELLPTIQANTIDKTWTCKVTAAGAANIKLGMDDYLIHGVPCLSLPYLPYTIGLKIKSPTSAGTVTVTMHVYDPDDGTYTSHVGTPVAANNTWKTVSVTSIADADEIGSHSYVGIELSFSEAGVYYVDQVSVQMGPYYNYDEARALTLNLLPPKENYVHNPSFELGSTGWVLNGVTFEQSTDIPMDGYPGSFSGKFTAAGNWDIQVTSDTDSALDVEPGIYFCTSMYAKSSNMSEMLMEMTVFDIDDNLVATFSDTHPMGMMWMRHYVNGLIDTNSAADHAHLKFSGGPGTFYMDMIQAQDTEFPTDYFDGSLPASYGVVWEGTAHQSNSLYYPGKQTKIRRLAETMNDWVPMNCWWRITTPAGLEYTVLDV